MTRKVDGATPGVRCAAKTLDQWCSRDAGHPGAHQSRHPTAFRGSISWWNEEYLRPPDEDADPFSVCPRCDDGSMKDLHVSAMSPRVADRLQRMAAGYFG